MLLPAAPNLALFRQAARKAERVMRHLSENYPKQGSTGDRGSAARKKAQGKPRAARTGAARLDRQLSRDGDRGAILPTFPHTHSPNRSPARIRLRSCNRGHGIASRLLWS